MEQQSNDNFDKLFRKVADKYPLNTNSKNWDIVATRLKEQKLIAKTKSNKKWQFAALLLLISFGIYFFNHYQHNTKQLAETNTANVVKTVPLKSLQTIKKIDQNESVNNAATQKNQPLISIREKNSKNISSSKFEKNNNVTYSHQSNIQANQTQDFDHLLKNNKDFQLANISTSRNNFQPSLILKSLNQNHFSYLVQNKKTGNTVTQEQKSTHIKLISRPEKLFYGSFFVAPDFATVKYQQINAPGFKIGVQLGYRINNSFSAEINLVRYHSDFYTLGKYFDRSHAKVSGNVTINRVNGKSKMTDVPFNIRYNFPKTNNSFFVTAGTNLILLTHTERYQYDVTKGNGINENISKRFSAVSGTKHFTNINLSAGYETPLLHLFKIKAEPYYQIPTKKFGIGSLPVTHFGLNIGIVKDLK